MVLRECLFFFFSSRRRHTRCSRDWSSDVCSSDLLQRQAEQLRNEGLCVETYLDYDDVGKQFKYAEAAGISWAIKRFDAASLSVTVRYLPERKDLALPLSEFKARLGVKKPA